MKKLSLATFVFLFGAVSASASSLINADFCPGAASCPTGVTEANLTISLDTATGDLNDYFFDITFKGNGLAPATLDQFSFTVTGVATPDGYEALPTLLSSSTDHNWQVFYDNVGGNPAGCTDNAQASSQEVCTESVGNNGAPLPGQTLTFHYYVDLAGTFQIIATTGVNLRAQFLDADGKNAGILSPNGIYTPGDPGVTTTDVVPEPASMILLGSGLLGLATRGRRKKKTA
jgi:hypothetical protein